MKQKPLIIITGPTASGKSSLGIMLAEHYSGEIVSADSMQVYKKMNIGTAKTSKEEQRTIPHHLLDILELEEDFSVAEFAGLAKEKIDEIHQRGKIPFLVGGTTLYIQAVIDNIQFFDLPKNEKLRLQLKDFANIHGKDALWERLNGCDPQLAKHLHPNNMGRVIRAIEVFESSGKPMSYWQEASLSIPSPYQTLLFGLGYNDRETLYQRINLRVDQMMYHGLLDEVKELYALPCSRTSKQAIGYKELWDHVQGTQLLEEAVDLLKMETRRYAKRQLTWMRGREDLQWVFRDDFQNDEFMVEYTINKVDEWLL